MKMKIYLELYRFYDAPKYELDRKRLHPQVSAYPIVMSTPSMSNAMMLCRNPFISRQIITSKPIKRKSAEHWASCFWDHVHIHCLSSLAALPSPQRSVDPSQAVVQEQRLMGLERWFGHFLLVC